ncbi:MAG: TetR/AcrR family transcriptional regulator [Hyphomicrobium sp.]
MTESRERVVAAAADLFLGAGFHKVGIAEICSVSRVNKGTFYHFFPSKIDLLLEVIDRYVSAVAAGFSAVAVSDAAPGRKLMDVFSVPQQRNTEWKLAYGVSSGCLIGNIILELASTEPIVREKGEWAIAELTGTLQPVIAEFLDAENITCADVPAAAEVLMGIIQGAQVQAKVKNDPSVFSRYAALAPGMIRSASAELSMAR